jgi:hypothetical protein
MQSFEFQVVIDCPLETVFSIYTDIDRWRNRNLFGEIRWVQGEPWQPESRLRIETLHPIRAAIDQVVQKFAPNENITYISHVLGITCETSVVFIPAGPNQTAITVGMHLVGTVSRALGFAIEPVIEKATKEFFEDLRKECEVTVRRAATSGATGI